MARVSRKSAKITRTRWISSSSGRYATRRRASSSIDSKIGLPSQGGPTSTLSKSSKAAGDWFSTE
jgi:hypothetical protein